MSITVKYLEELGIDKEIAEKIFSERSKEIEAEKAKRAVVENELAEKKSTFESLTAEFEALKKQNANGSDWKTKFEALQADIDAKQKQAEADRILSEKNKAIEQRFNEAVGNKQFYNEPTRSFYLKKFGDAIETKEYEGKGDKDIFQMLTKDDNTVFKGVTAVRLDGGRPSRSGNQYNSKDEIMSIKDTAERQKAISENMELFV